MKSLDLRTIEEIGLDSHGHLFVRPVSANPDEFAYIYRDASGVRWSSQLRALHAYEPERWDPTDLYRQIIAAIPGELRALIQGLQLEDE